MTGSRPTPFTRAAVESWRRFWFAPVPPHVYALLRMALGLSGCAILLTRLDAAAFWDLSGFIPLDSGRGVDFKQWLLASGNGAWAGRLIFALIAGAFVAMTLGIWSRVTVPLAFAATLLMQTWNHLPMTGADGALRVFLFCLMWADTGAVWSVDALRRRTAGGSPATNVIAPLRLIRWQLAIIYLSAGLFKIDSAVWRNGSAVYYVLNSNVHQRVPYFIPPEFEIVSTVLTYTTLLWELGFAFLILFRRTRTLALTLGVLIHLGMLTVMEVGPFHIVMLASYIAFLDPNRVSEFVRRPRSTYMPVSADHNPVPRTSDLTT